MQTLLASLAMLKKLDFFQIFSTNVMLFAQLSIFIDFSRCYKKCRLPSSSRPFIHNKDHSVENGAAKMAFGCCQWPNDLDQCSLTVPFCVQKIDIF